MLRRLVASALIATLAAPSFVRADDAADIAAARELATAGVLLADAGKCDEAIDKLSRAEKLHHAPTILGRLGECQVEVGRLVEGTENLQKVIREPLGPNPPSAFVQAVERAKKVLIVAEPKIARLTIFVEPETASVTIDGVAVSQAILGTPRPMDPGAHVLEARAPGYRAAMTTVQLTTSQLTSITIKLEKAPDEPTEPEPPKVVEAPKPPPKVVEPAQPPPHPPSSPARTAATVSFVIGGVSLVAGATFGLFALDRKNKLDRECPDKRCPEEMQDTLNAAQRWASLSTVGFVVGGAALVAGGVMLFTAPRETKLGRITPTVGLGTIGLEGEF